MALLPTDAAPELKRRVKQKEFVNKALYNRLSDLRREIAMDQNVPPFIIFTNATLKDMGGQSAAHARADASRRGRRRRQDAAIRRRISAGDRRL